MTTVTNSETLEQIADKIAADLGYHGGTDNQAALAEAILSALRNEREACAKVAERMAEIHRNYFVQLESKINTRWPNFNGYDRRRLPKSRGPSGQGQQLSDTQ